MKQKDKIYQTKEHEGKERVYAYVVIMTGNGRIELRAHSWGKIDGVQFFDTADDQHIELHGTFNFIIHIPAQGSTFDADGKVRELQDNSLIVVN